MLHRQNSMAAVEKVREQIDKWEKEDIFFLVANLAAPTAGEKEAAAAALAVEAKERKEAATTDSPIDVSVYVTPPSA
jgi:hypothetical protein